MVLGRSLAPVCLRSVEKERTEGFLRGVSNCPDDSSCGSLNQKNRQWLLDFEANRSNVSRQDACANDDSFPGLPGHAALLDPRQVSWKNWRNVSGSVWQVMA